MLVGVYEKIDFTSTITSPTTMSGNMSGIISYQGETESYSDDFAAQKITYSASSEFKVSKSGNDTKTFLKNKSSLE